MLAAGDTFRAAAIEQLKIWGERTRLAGDRGAQGSDPASLAFNALTRGARAKASTCCWSTPPAGCRTRPN